VPPIYHITHINNLAGIIQRGGLHCDRTAQNMKAMNIGHTHIKGRRLNRIVPLGPMGTVGDYVPFYFAPRSPMLFAISRGNVAGYTAGQQPVIYLCSSTEAVNAAGLQWVFTEGHADMGYTDFFDDFKDLDKIDWNLMKAKYWNAIPDDPDRSRRRQAEFLVRDFFPWQLVHQIAVYGNATSAAVAQILAGNRPPVVIQQGWYY
jgi:ssDNA thymidine ADP-ribosyltransferase, DarT